MSKAGKLDLLGVSTLAAVTAALLAGWIASTPVAKAQELRPVPANPVALAPDGHMKLTVVASRQEAVTLMADGRMKLTVVADRAPEVALTRDGRMKLTVHAEPVQAVAATAAPRRHS